MESGLGIRRVSVIILAVCLMATLMSGAASAQPTQSTDGKWLCIGTAEACEVRGRPAEVDGTSAPPHDVIALSDRGQIINDFVWRDGPRNLDYFSCDQTGCLYAGTVSIRTEVTLREPRESVISKEITNLVQCL